jgi:SAM-dependent methyltransferase
MRAQAPAVQPSEIFDRNLRRLRRDRAAPHFARHSFIRDAIVEGLLDRLDLVKRNFARALDLGTSDGSLARALRARGIEVVAGDAGMRFAAEGVQFDEDRLPFAPESFDLIVSAGVLDSVNDVPGALIQCRRALKPDGLFLAGFVGAGSLAWLRRALLEADQAAGGAIPQRVHPLIDVRAAGDLLTRAGFVLTVADGESLDVGYSDPFRLLADLRGMAGTNMLVGEKRPLTRGRLAHLAGAFSEAADADGRLRERFELVFMTGWAPGPGQPQPARRGSGTASLAAALRRQSE